MRLTLLFEHPTWSVDLLARFASRGIDVEPVDVGATTPSVPVPAAPDGPSDLWVNRVNALPSPGRPSRLVATTRHLLLAAEAAGVPIFNGFTPFSVGGSKAAQASLFAAVGAATPGAVLIDAASQAPAAADQLGYPVLTKPNIGGSGSGIGRYDTAEEIRSAVSDGLIDLGVDRTGLVQRLIPSADGLVHRIEMLGSELFYATDQAVQEDVFNYCAVDGCSRSEEAIRLVEPDPAMLEIAAAVMARADADIGAIEYLVSADDGAAYVYDFNPYSNFIVGRDHELGFDPIDRYIDAVMAKAETHGS